MRIDLPRELPFSTFLQVRITDINYGGHLGNDALISYLHEARTRCLHDRGLQEGDCGGGIGLVVTELTAVYQAEAFQGEILRIDVGTAEVRGSSASFYYQLERPSDGQEIARARTGIAFFDFQARRPRRAPPAFREAFPSSDP